jgi:hypothetical protein
MTIQYKATSGSYHPVHASVSLPRVLDALDTQLYDLEDPGICLHCGEDAMGVEPDARHYKCEWCGNEAVFGASEILLIGAYHEVKEGA